MADQKKFLDYEGVKHLWSKINMQDYPNNETLMAVINAIDETKANKEDLYRTESGINYIIKNDTFTHNDEPPNAMGRYSTWWSGDYTLVYEYLLSGNGMNDNKTIYIQWDGIEYELIPYESNDAARVSVDNLFAIDFGGYYFDYTDRILIHTWDTNAHTLSIGVPGEVIYQVEEKYIPDIIARTSDIITPVQPDWNENDETALDYIKNRPFYEVPEAWTQISFVENDKSSVTTGKLNLTSYTWTEDRVYRVRVDGVEYTFDRMAQTSTLNAWGSVVYYIGASYIPLNSNMNWSEYPFCFCTADFTNIYAVFEDGTTNHTVEFFESEGEIHKIDIKYLPIATDDEIIDMLIEEDMIATVIDSDGAIFADENNNILLW